MGRLIEIGGVFVDCEDVFALEPVEPVLDVTGRHGPIDMPPVKDWTRCCVVSNGGARVCIDLPAREVARLRDEALEGK